MAENPNTDPNDKATPAPAVDNATKDRIAGGLEEAKGRVKESAGALTGNESLKAEGASEQISGKAQNKKGQWKERLKGWIDKL